MSRFILTTVFLGAVLSAGLLACGPKKIATSGKNTIVSGKAAIGGAYSLTDHTGKAVTDATYFGKPQLIYFGYAYCPDVCPTALQQMGAALDIAQRKDASIASYYQPLFITIDPERDTIEKLALYVTANGFPKGLIGLTGTETQIEQVKKSFAVIGNKIEDTSNSAGYTYDHTSLIYLMDAKGEFVDIFTHADAPDIIAKRLIAYKKTER